MHWLRLTEIHALIGSERGARTNLEAHGDLDGVREVVDAPQHGGVHADAEADFLRRILTRPLLLLAPAAAAGELLSLRRGGPGNGRRRRPVHGRVFVCEVGLARIELVCRR